MYQDIFSASDLAGSTNLTYPLSVAGCHVRINNQSQYAVDLYLNNQLYERVDPYSYLVANNDNYTITVNRSIQSNQTQATNYVSVKAYDSPPQTTPNSTQFQGTQQVEITNSNITATISQSNMDVTVTNSSLPVTIENSLIQVDGNVTASIQGGQVNANISNASLNAQVINDYISENALVLIGSGSFSATLLANGSAITAKQTAQMGFYDGVIITYKSSNNRQYTLAPTSGSGVFVTSGLDYAPALQPLTMNQPVGGGSTGYYIASGYTTDATAFNQVQIDFQNQTGATISTDVVNYSIYAIRATEGTLTKPVSTRNQYARTQTVYPNTNMADTVAAGQRGKYYYSPAIDVSNAQRVVFYIATSNVVNVGTDNKLTFDIVAAEQNNISSTGGYVLSGVGGQPSYVNITDSNIETITIDSEMIPQMLSGYHYIALRFYFNNGPAGSTYNASATINVQSVVLT